jgi:hypothetical protein
MLRILAAVPGASGTGIDLSRADLARGRDNAAARGLASRASFIEESAVGTTRGPAASWNSPAVTCRRTLDMSKAPDLRSDLPRKSIKAGPCASRL